MLKKDLRLLSKDNNLILYSQLIGEYYEQKTSCKKAKKPSLRELIEGIETDVNTLKTDMIEVKADIKAIKNTPTMKRELDL